MTDPRPTTPARSAHEIHRELCANCRWMLSSLAVGVALEEVDAADLSGMLKRLREACGNGHPELVLEVRDV